MTQEKIELLSQMREAGIPNKKIAQQLQVSILTISQWVKKLGLPKRSPGGGLPKVKPEEIILAVQKLGCCTRKEIQKEIGKLSLNTLSDKLNVLARERKINKIKISKRGRRGGGHKYKMFELFGNLTGKILYFIDEKRFAERILSSISKSPNRGVRASLTWHLKRFGISIQTIQFIHLNRLKKTNGLPKIEQEHSIR